MASSSSYYREQANLFLRMSLACGDVERAVLLEAQARMYLNLAAHAQEEPTDLNDLLTGFNDRQLRKA